MFLLLTMRRKETYVSWQYAVIQNKINLGKKKKSIVIRFPQIYGLAYRNVQLIFIEFFKIANLKAILLHR